MLKEYALAPYPKPNEVNMGILLLVWFFFWSLDQTLTGIIF